jgi:hypothetical protein
MQAHHVITQIQTDYADKKDSQCLPSLLNNTINNLKAEGLQIEEVFAEARYSSGDALKALEEKNIVGYIPNFGQYKPTREGFTLNREKIRQIRSATVEPVLGTLVNYLAMRRVNTRGIKQANKCIITSAVAYNLKKLPCCSFARQQFKINILIPF